MSELLAFEHFSLDPKGPTLTTSIYSGQIVAVMGPSGAGKSDLLHIIAGLERPGQGLVRRRSGARLAGQEVPGKRSKVQSIARDAAGDQASDLLVALHLGEFRQRSYGDLSNSQLAACDLLAPLASDAGVALIDGQLDLLDPWCLEDVLRAMRRRSDMGFIVVTHRPELAERLDFLLFMRSRQIRFAGTPGDLVRTAARHELHIATNKPSSIRGLVEPFEVSISEAEGGLQLRAKEGQEVAAKLLTEGYGDVDFAISRSPTLAEALLTM